MGCLLVANLDPSTDKSRSLHAKTCKCDDASLELPVMGGTLACDGSKAIDMSTSMSLEIAQEVRACAECDPARGPAACAAEQARLQRKDPKLGEYLEKVHIPRCSKL